MRSSPLPTQHHRMASKRRERHRQLGCREVENRKPPRNRPDLLQAGGSWSGVGEVRSYKRCVGCANSLIGSVGCDGSAQSPSEGAQLYDSTLLLALTAELDPDVVVVDVSMPGLNGAQVTTRLHEMRPDRKVLTPIVHEDMATSACF